MEEENKSSLFHMRLYTNPFYTTEIYEILIGNLLLRVDCVCSPALWASLGRTVDQCSLFHYIIPIFMLFEPFMDGINQISVSYVYLQFISFFAMCLILVMCSLILLEPSYQIELNLVSRDLTTTLGDALKCPPMPSSSPLPYLWMRLFHADHEVCNP